MVGMQYLNKHDLAEFTTTAVLQTTQRFGKLNGWSFLTSQNVVNFLTLTWW